MRLLLRGLTTGLIACIFVLGVDVRLAGVGMVPPGMHSGSAFKMAAVHRYVAAPRRAHSAGRFSGPHMAHGPLARSARAAAKRTDVPARLLWAIAMRESSLHPWSVSLGGKPRYFASREQAALFVQSLPRRANFDIGPMQINSFWLRHLGLNATSLLDPPTNFMTAARILQTEFRRYGKNWKALAAYHAGGGRLTLRGRQYARRVLKLYKSYAQELSAKEWSGGNGERGTVVEADGTAESTAVTEFGR
jgi:hypothetical protein